ncbi:MAG TPA: hypothetical protein DCY79_24595 [Planctomycetaceae bacterium]|nr:hypothetical protein [Planctomycetaceae bacterium]
MTMTECLRRPYVLFALLLFFTAPVRAQNIGDYRAISNPYLFLLREPEVLDDLGLDYRQRIHLQKLNDRIDGPLLASRNKPQEQAKKILEQLLTETRAGVEQILTEKQQQRVSQLMLRARGLGALTTPKVSEALQLSQSQQSRIKNAVEESRKAMAALQKKLQEGEPQERLEREAERVGQRTQQKVFEEHLSGAQGQMFARLLGRPFQPSRLGKVRFKAPELDTTDGLIQAANLRIADLKGEVIALHFWAFG